MSNKFYLAFDFGIKRIGVAVGQSITCSATALEIISAKNGSPNFSMLDKLVKKWEPSAFIVGLPLTMEGETQRTTKLVRKFSKMLIDRYSIDVIFVDERLTTKSAREIVYNSGGYKLLNSEKIDAIAAKLILEDWLSNNKNI